MHDIRHANIRIPVTEHDVGVVLSKTRQMLLTLREQAKSEISVYQPDIKEVLFLCASFFSEEDLKKVLLVSNNDSKELKAVENSVNSFEDNKLQKLIEEITLELQLPASSAVVEQARKNLVARDRFLENHQVYSSGDIACMNSLNATEGAVLVNNWLNEGKIFSVEDHGKQYYPSFQFNNTRPRKVIADVIKVFDKENTGWQLALWFDTPNALLNGKSPVDVIDSDPTGIIQAIKEGVNPTLF